MGIYCTYDVEGVGDGDGIAEDIQLAGVLTPVSLLYFRNLQPVLSRQAQPTVLPHQHPVQKKVRRTARTVPLGVTDRPSAPASCTEKG